MKKEYSRIRVNEAQWIKEEEARLLEKFKNEASEDTDLETFIRANASPEYLKELDAVLAI